MLYYFSSRFQKVSYEKSLIKKLYKVQDNMLHKRKRSHKVFDSAEAEVLPEN
jgi:hypothetical protein